MSQPQKCSETGSPNPALSSECLPTNARVKVIGYHQHLEDIYVDDPVEPPNLLFANGKYVQGIRMDPVRGSD